MYDWKLCKLHTYVHTKAIVFVKIKYVSKDKKISYFSQQVHGDCTCYKKTLPKYMQCYKGNEMKRAKTKKRERKSLVEDVFNSLGPPSNSMRLSPLVNFKTPMSSKYTQKTLFYRMSFNAQHDLQGVESPL